jgi:hypothetical protein
VGTFAPKIEEMDAQVMRRSARLSPPLSLFASFVQLERATLGSMSNRMACRLELGERVGFIKLTEPPHHTNEGDRACAIS